MAIIRGDGGANNIPGTAGDDQLFGEDGDDILTGLAGDDLLEGGAGADQLDGGEGDDTVRGGSGNDIIFGGSESDLLDGGSGNDRLDGGEGQDILVGGSGSDVLFGRGGADIMRGGADNDFYLLEDGDTIEELAFGGHDEVYSTLVATTTLGANLETLVLLRPGATGIGNELNNVLIGTTGAERLDGGIGADVMIGGLGDDVYVVDSSLDAIFEAAGEGRDRVETSVNNYVLSDTLEDLTLIGAARNGFGNAGANVITGNDLDNSLIGLGGADTMIGGHGNDNYSVDNVNDVIIEGDLQGTNDSVGLYGSADGYVLAANVENMFLLDDPALGLVVTASGNGVANRIDGNRANNTLFGGGGRDTISGGAGDDRLIGGAENDLLIGEAGADRFILERGAGVDRIQDLERGVDKLEVDSAQFGNIGTIQAGLNFFTAFNPTPPAGYNGPFFIRVGQTLYFDNNGRLSGGLETIAEFTSSVPSDSDFLVVNRAAAASAAEEAFVAGSELEQALGSGAWRVDYDVLF